MINKSDLLLQNRELVEAYANDPLKSRADLLKALPFACSSTFLYKFLKSEGIKWVRTTRRKVVERTERTEVVLAFARNPFKSKSDLARELGVSKQAVSQMLQSRFPELKWVKNRETTEFEQQVRKLAKDKSVKKSEAIQIFGMSLPSLNCFLLENSIEWCKEPQWCQKIYQENKTLIDSYAKSSSKSYRELGIALGLSITGVRVIIESLGLDWERKPTGKKRKSQSGLHDKK